MDQIVKFSTPNLPVPMLPNGFKQAIQNSIAGESTSSDDQVVGSIASGMGFCASDQFKDTLYCACVNAPVSSPECIFLPCNAQSIAYKTTGMQKTLSAAADQCPRIINCTQIRKMGGAHNLAQGVKQEMNCGGPVQQIITHVEKNTALYYMVGGLFLLIIIVAIVLLLASGEDKDKKPSSKKENK